MLLLGCAEFCRTAASVKSAVCAETQHTTYNIHTHTHTRAAVASRRRFVCARSFPHFVRVLVQFAHTHTHTRARALIRSAVGGSAQVLTARNRAHHRSQPAHNDSVDHLTSNATVRSSSSRSRARVVSVTAPPPHIPHRRFCVSRVHV